MANISRDDIQLFYDHGIYRPTKTLYIGEGTDGVDAQLAERVIKGLQILDSMKPNEPLNIILNNSGGDTVQGLAIYDSIRRCESDTHITVVGHASSVAAWILQAGDVRLMEPNATIMIHQGSIWIGDEHPDNLERQHRQYKRELQLFEDLLLERITERHPSYTRKQLRNRMRFDDYLNATEAVELGLCDRIVGEQ